MDATLTVPAKSERPLLTVDVHLLLQDEGRVLLGLRANTGYYDGYYHVPAGHLEKEETFVQALIRETAEELGIAVDEEDVELAYVLHNKSNNDRIGLFFRVGRWGGDIQNNELDKCAALEWFPLNAPPENTVPYLKHALHDIGRKVTIGDFGWPGREKG